MGERKEPAAKPVDWCRVGDSIKGDIGGLIGMVRLPLKTPESAAYANELILTGRWVKVAVDTDGKHR